MEDYEELTPTEDAINRELDQFIAAGEQTLTISGGEPTLLKRRLIKLVERARAGGVRFVEVQTNAVLIDEPYADALAEAGVTSAFVSLLSHVPELHDELAGLEGAFDKCVAGIQALLSANIRVALNPVTAHSTQALIADYIQFVADVLPGVSSISLSAVQPHGRASQNLTLMPDYSVLREHVREAQAVAATNGIDLLNPYCGLPLCVGWSEQMGRSVEAIESQLTHSAQGLQNSGNKRHGEPCIDCGLRTRCGGAWHAYWEHREGSGLGAPWSIPLPWTPSDPRVQVVDVRGGPAPSEDGTEEPIARWLWCTTLADQRFADLLAKRFSHVALEVAPSQLKSELARIRRWSAANQLLAPQRQLHIHLRLTPDFNALSAQEATDLLRLSKAVGVSRAHTMEPGPHTHRIYECGLS